MFIEVNQKMYTGNTEIDAHHKQMIEQFNKFMEAFRLRRHKEELQALFDHLVDYATYHTNAEEMWMMDIRYPGAAAHAEEHKVFIKRLSEIQKFYVEGRAAVSLEVISFLGRWLKKHIYGADQEIARYQRQKNVRAKAA